jgi:uncharacterized protein (TIGR03435 family)
MQRIFFGFVVVALTLQTPLELQAQSPATPAENAAFEVASVKRNTSGDQRVAIQNQPGGLFRATNVTLRLLLGNAYRGEASRIEGGPSWFNSDRFDILAKAEGDAPPDQFRAMLRALLQERFKLSVHHETRELPIYALVVARSDRKLGPHLRPAAVDCSTVGRGSAPPPISQSPTERLPCGMRQAPGRIQAGGVPMAPLVGNLSNFVDRLVVDRTGLKGNFDLELEWTPDQLRDLKPLADLPPGAQSLVNGVPFDPNGPSIFTALQEQLGLKLESTKGPVEVLVIDSVERPTED